MLDELYARKARLESGRDGATAVKFPPDLLARANVPDIASILDGEEMLGHGLELRCLAWSVEPLTIESVRSGFFDDETRFPRGTISPDCALLMRGVDHE